MKKSHSTHQKKIAILLIGLGVFLFLFIVGFLYFNVLRIQGFPQLLPRDATVAFVEFRTNLDEPILKKINETAKINWQEIITNLGAERAALVFLKSKSEGELLPFLLLQVSSLQKSFDFLKNYQNPAGKIKELSFSGISAFSTSAIHFTFLSDILIVSASEEGLKTFLAYQKPLTSHLDKDSSFTKIRNNISGDIFFYTKPDFIPESVYAIISKYVGYIPFLSPTFSALGISAEKNGAAWAGSSYALLKKPIAPKPEQAYSARLLPVLPPDFELLISGQDLPRQFEKWNTERISLPNVNTVIASLMNTYLPGLDFEKEIASLINREFALTINFGKVLFVTEMRNDIDPVESLLKQFEVMEKIRKAFQSIAGRFTPKTREVILPDGTKAGEFIPDTSKVKPFYEVFNNIEIKGFVLGKNSGIYDSFSAGKWFISNDLSTLKKSILLTQEPGRNFRDSETYRESLQPILRNPELLGIGMLRQGIFSFSKRTNSSHMETNWKFVLR